jgi:hypothetical protein
MCLYSNEHPTRRAREGETLQIVSVGSQIVAAPIIPEPNIECACQKSGDQVRFEGLPANFQQKHCVHANAVAYFKEATRNRRGRDQEDGFDFANGSVVSLAQMPLNTLFTVTSVVDKDRTKKTVMPRTTREKLELVAMSFVALAIGLGSYLYFS